MNHAPDTGQHPVMSAAGYAAEFALLDGPTLEELSLLADIAEQAEQLAQLQTKLGAAEAEREAARQVVRELRAAHPKATTTITGLRSELAEAGRQREQLRAALADVVDRVMRGERDPLGDALDVLEQTGSGLLDLVDVPRRLLAVAA
jgi:chromosome segregation ATPase